MPTTKTRRHILRDLNAERPYDKHYGLVIVIDPIDDDTARVQAEDALVLWFHTEAEVNAAWAIACELSDRACSNTPAIKKLVDLDTTRYWLEQGTDGDCFIDWATVAATP